MRTRCRFRITAMKAALFYITPRKTSVPKWFRFILRWRLQLKSKLSKISQCEISVDLNLGALSYNSVGPTYLEEDYTATMFLFGIFR